MPEPTTPDNAVADAALESVTAEVQTKRSTSRSAADERLANLEQQIREANDRALRSHAELENFRKRSQRELADERRYAIVPFARDLLAVVDNLERAIEAAQAQADALARGGRESERGVREGEGSAREGEAPAEPVRPATDITHLLDGVKLVATQLDGVLKTHGCVRIDTVGERFDPNYHQAIAQEPSEEHPAGTISRAAQSGYKLHDRVIRPAQVFVSTGPANKKST
jgi:molecular chaperone GrpE